MLQNLHPAHATADSHAAAAHFTSIRHILIQSAYSAKCVTSSPCCKICIQLMLLPCAWWWWSLAWSACLCPVFRRVSYTFMEERGSSSLRIKVCRAPRNGKLNRLVQTPCQLWVHNSVVPLGPRRLRKWSLQVLTHKKCCACLGQKLLLWKMMCQSLRLLDGISLIHCYMMRE